MKSPENTRPATLASPKEAPYDIAKCQRYTGLVAALLLVIAALFTVRDFLPALAWTVVFAIALWPLFQRMAARWPSCRRGLLPGLFILGVVLIFVLPVVVVAVPLAAEAQDAGQWFSQVEQSGVAPPHFVGNLPDGSHLIELWQQKFGQPGQISVLTKGAFQGGGAKEAGTIGRETLHRFVLFGFMLLGLFFFLRDSEDVIEQLKIGIRRALGPRGEHISLQIINSVHGTVNGLVLVGLSEGLILGVAYVTVGVPHPTLFGLFTAILAMVPFGAALAIFGATVALFASGSSAAAAITIICVGVVVTFVADHFIRPALIGGATRLPFLWVLLGILGGVSAWGLIGLFVGPAIMAALILVWREWISGSPTSK